MAYKPDKHGRDHRDGGEDPISGVWILVLDEGDTPPAELVEDEDYVFLQNGAVQPADPLADFSFRRGLSKLDTKGHLDVSGFSSGDVAVTLPTPFRLPEDQFHMTVLDEGGSPVAAMVYHEAATGDVIITYPV